MKKIFFTLLTILLISASAIAQNMQPLPMDPKFRTGKLDNGLTYYIAKNAEPKGQAEFYIAQKVGAILEEENQRGLAHFLEHMAFNGSKNFPGNSLIAYLESIGVKFGINLNASTGIDQTIYNISAVPLKRPGIIDSCLMILHDWACAINLDQEDIDKERGVIREELRTRSNAQMRMLEAVLPDIYPDNKYGHRLPGGLVKVIDSFTYDELRAYYHKWYRPDLQGIIVVGDFDIDAVEAKVKTLFGSIPKPVNPAVRTEFQIQDTKEPLISVASDPEATSTSIFVAFKQDVLPADLRKTVASIMSDYINSLVVSMTKSRLSEILQKPNPPFVQASASYGDYIVSPTKAAFEFNVAAKEGETDRALRALVNESERIRKFGFTASELERAKANYMSRLEQIYKDKEKQRNEFFVNEALTNFVEGEATPGIDLEYNIIQQVGPMITIDKVNAYAMSLPKQENLAIVVMMPKKDGLEVPTKEHVAEIYKNALQDNVEAYKETVSNEPLISKEPVAGKIVSVSKDPVSQASVWKLSNGATVVVKKTDFKADQIVMSAVSLGGFSLADPKEVYNTKILGNAAAVGGLGKFSAVDLRKVLAGKNASVSTAININQESMGGNAAPKDIETLMQLLYLNFTALRTDDEAYGALRERVLNQLKTASVNPMSAYSDTIQQVLYGNNPYAQRLNPEILEKTDYHKALDLVKARFANAADFTFIFVGNVDTLALKPLVEKYIASLPADIKAPKENWKDVGMKFRKGERKNNFGREMQTPKSTVYTIYTGAMKYSLENKIMGSMMSQVFDIVFTRTLREEMQGTYGVEVNMNLFNYPYEGFMFLFGFDTNNDLKDKLLERAHIEIENVKKNGIEPADFTKIVEYMTKNRAEQLRDNEYWLGVIASKYLYGRDITTEYDTILKSVTPEKLKQYIINVLAKADKAEVIMVGKAKESK
jgi:zinc protease